MQKTWIWSVYISPFMGQPVDDILTTCQHAGLSAVDGTYRFFQNHSDVEMDAFAKKFREGGIHIKTFHLPFSAADDVSSFYETIRRGAVDRIQIWMEKASRMGASVGILHPTTTGYNTNTEGLDTYLKQLGKSLKTLLPVAERLNFKLAIENIPPAQGNRFGSRPEHFTAIVKNFSHPNLGFCLDTGHALVAVEPDQAHDFLNVMAPYMVAFHLTDNAGDRDSHLAPGHGLVDWNPVFRKAAEIQFSHPMTIETAPFASGPNFTPDAWKQMILDTDALVESAFQNA
ncbi:MAG: sugar phosphate isomerase/epimerase [Candidatus Latescibacteria bacterium]|nr:sugar phosphate isomerase/epimerase [Candidatus Latescibacterota bacterium]MBT5831238.1 sugar phosphate isomerase/epimerase [Candidatus Latescibacterota bacterium]